MFREMDALDQLAGSGFAPMKPRGDPQRSAAPAVEAKIPHFAIVYHYGSGPLIPLRLDWRSDGLSFWEGGHLQPS